MLHHSTIQLAFFVGFSVHKRFENLVQIGPQRCQRERRCAAPSRLIQANLSAACSLVSAFVQHTNAALLLNSVQFQCKVLCIYVEDGAITSSRKRIVDANYPLRIAALHRFHVDEARLALMRFKEKLRHSRRPVYGVVLLVVKYFVTKYPAKMPVLTSCTGMSSRKRVRHSYSAVVGTAGFSGGETCFFL